MMLKVFGATPGGETHVEEVPDRVGSRAAAGGVPTAARSARRLPRRWQQAYIVYFDTGQSALSPEATATVSQAAAAFKQGGTAVGVRGHADTVGDTEFNLQLSRQRAAAVKDALQRNGVPGAAILSGGVGEQNLPVATADQTPERRNRSVTSRRLAGQALMSDMDYCAALARKWRAYPGRTHLVRRRTRSPSAKLETTPRASRRWRGYYERQDPVAVALSVTHPVRVDCTGRSSCEGRLFYTPSIVSLSFPKNSIRAGSDCNRSCSRMPRRVVARALLSTLGE